MKRASIEKPKKQQLVSIIVPTFNRVDKLKACLESIIKNDYKQKEIIVINDNPNIDLRTKLSKYLLKNITLIQHKKELKWVASRNEGAKVARGEILFFVDDDNILYRDTISNLIKKYIKIKRVGLLGPLMYNNDGNLWFFGAKATWINPYPAPVNKMLLNSELIETDTIPNAYVISKKLYIKIGGEDEKLLHHEDTDLAQRLIKAGYKNYILTKARLIHDYENIASHITPFRLYTIIRDHIIIERRYAKRFSYFLFLIFFLPINTSYYFFYKIPFILKGSKKEYYKSYIRGFLDGFKNIK